jgi:hypothetical protein
MCEIYTTISSAVVVNNNQRATQSDPYNSKDDYNCTAATVVISAFSRCFLSLYLYSYSISIICDHFVMILYSIVITVTYQVSDC